jgi:hypothetical protein
MFKRTDIKQEHIDQAFELLSSYCKEQNLNLIDFIQNKKNIKPASKEIHSKLPWALKFLLHADTIENMITENHDWIVEKAKEQSKK